MKFQNIWQAWCYVAGHVDRRLRKNEDLQPLPVTPEMTAIPNMRKALRLCTRCGRLRAVKSRKPKQEKA